MNKEKQKRKHKPRAIIRNENSRNCYNCNNCEYIGEGGYMCSINNDIVIEDWQPTEDYRSCGGKEFERI